MKKLTMLLVLLLSSQFTVGADKEQFITITLTLKKKQSLASLYSRFVRDDSIISKNSPMTKKTLAENPEIDNWKRIQPATTVTLIINKKFLDPEKMKAYWASLPKKKKIIKKKEKKKEERKKKHYGLQTSYGQVQITDEDDNTLEMKLTKVGFSYSNKLKDHYQYKVVLSTVKFSSLEYSEAEGSEDYDEYLPEFNFTVSRAINEKFFLGVGYDYLNYFVLSDASSTKFNLDPEEIHRLNVKPSYQINANLNLISSLGYLTGAAKGFDASIGVSSAFLEKKSLTWLGSLIAYRSQLNVKDRTESSNAFVLNLGVQF